MPCGQFGPQQLVDSRFVRKAFRDPARLDGPKSLRDALMSQSHLFVQKLVHDLTMYGIGRVTTASDMPAVRAVERAAAAEGYRFSSVVLGIVKSVPFQMRKAEAGATTEVVDRP